MFFVSYVFIAAFHQALNLNRIIIQRSYLHSLEELTTIKYLNDDQMKFTDLQTLNQLKDIAIDVSKRKCKNAIGNKFCVETTLQYETFTTNSLFCKRTSFNKNESSFASFSYNRQDNWLRT